MGSLRTSVVLTAVVAALAPAPLLGQRPDTSAFHRGQWGVNFNIGSGFVGAGLIHFRNPTRAFVLDLGGSVATSTGNGQFGATNSSAATLSLGGRRYHPFGDRLFGFRTLGIEGSFSHVFLGGPSPNTQNRWSGGVFGELGAGWLVTPHLAVGGAWRLSVDYTRSNVIGAGHNSGWSFALGQVRLTGQIYF